MDLLIIGSLFTIGCVILLVIESHRYKAKQPKTFKEVQDGSD